MGESLRTVPVDFSDRRTRKQKGRIMQTGKIAVFFPGIGYNNDKPLLYFSRKIALEHGYEVITIDYNGIDTDCLKSKEKMLDAFNLASGQTEKQLKSTDFSSYEDIIFASKSIGTVAASIYAAKHDIPARQVYYTPFPQTFSLATEGNGLVFFGDRDPLIDPDTIRKLCDDKRLHYKIIEGANHSLETGHVHIDVDNINNIIQEAEDYLVGGPIYRFTVPKRDGALQSLREYRGKVLLIVNTATGCGFTPQYEALESIYKELNGEGFEILDFPCDQFGHQAPGTSDDIHSFCTSRYEITFPQFAKIKVNGEDSLELFAFLKSRQGFRGFLMNSPESIHLEKQAREADPDYRNNSDIKWNFTKFLVNRIGQVIDRFEPDAGTEIVRQAIEKELRR